MDNKLAGGILLILVVIYGVSEWLDRPIERTFDPQIIQIDPQTVTEIEIIPGNGQESLRLLADDDGWNVLQSDIKAKADQQRVEALLESVKSVVGLRYVTKSPDQWGQYEVGTSATRVQIKSNRQILTDFRVGRFAFNQQSRSGTSYLRLEEEDGVVAVDGFLSLGFPTEIDGYRDKVIWSLGEDQIQKVEWSPSETVLSKSQDNAWNLDGVALDSAQAATYITGISTLQANRFYYGGILQNESSLLTIRTADDSYVVMTGTGDSGNLVLNFNIGINSLSVLDQDSALYNKLNPLQLHEQ